MQHAYTKYFKYLDPLKDKFSKAARQTRDRRAHMSYEKRDKMVAYDKHTATTDLKLRAKIKLIPLNVPAY